jgi:hypothetical protein
MDISEITNELQKRFPDFVKDMERAKRCDWTETPYINKCYEILWELVVKAEQQRQTLPEPHYYSGDGGYPENTFLEWEIGEEKLIVTCEDQTVRLSLYEKYPETDDNSWAARSLLVKKFFNWE